MSALRPRNFPHPFKARHLTSANTATTDHFGLEGRRVIKGLTWRMDSGRWAEELGSQKQSGRVLMKHLHPQLLQCPAAFPSPGQYQHLPVREGCQSPKALHKHSQDMPPVHAPIVIQQHAGLAYCVPNTSTPCCSLHLPGMLFTFPLSGRFLLWFPSLILPPPVLGDSLSYLSYNKIPYLLFYQDWNW